MVLIDTWNNELVDKELSYTFEVRHGSRHHLVEDVVGSFQRLLGDDTSLLEQVCNKFRLKPPVWTDNSFKTYKFRCRHQPVCQWARSGYG